MPTRVRIEFPMERFAIRLVYGLCSFVLLLCISSQIEMIFIGNAPPQPLYRRKGWALWTGKVAFKLYWSIMTMSAITALGILMVVLKERRFCMRCGLSPIYKHITLFELLGMSAVGGMGGGFRCMSCNV